MLNNDAVDDDAAATPMISSHPLTPPGCVPTFPTSHHRSSSESETASLRSSTHSSMTPLPLPRTPPRSTNQPQPPQPSTPRPANQPQPPQSMSPPTPRTPVVPQRAHTRARVHTRNDEHVHDHDHDHEEDADDSNSWRYGASSGSSPLGTHSASVQLLSESPLLLVFDHFLSPSECDDLMAIAAPELRRSRVTDGKLSEGRTSSSTFLTGARQDEPLVGGRKRNVSNSPWLNILTPV